MSVVGATGSVIVATRGAAGPGEVMVTVGGSRECLIAYSDHPLPRGTAVLVVEKRGPLTVYVQQWPDAVA